jgi:hypothetical protein
VTKHLFRNVLAYLASKTPSYGEIDDVIHFRTSHPRLWRVMVSSLANLVTREGWGLDGGAFWRFCRDRPVLYEAVFYRVGEREREGREQQAFEMERFARRGMEKREKQRKRGMKEKKQGKGDAEVRRAALAKGG